METKMCDQITCGIISAMGLIQFIITKNTFYGMTAVILCGYMWYKIAAKKADENRLHLTGAAKNTNIYILVLIGLYVFGTSQLTFDNLDALKTCFTNVPLIILIASLGLATWILQDVFKDNINQKIVGIILICAADFLGLFFARKIVYLTALKPVIYPVIILTTLVSLVRAMESRSEDPIVGMNGVFVGLIPLSIVNLYMGDGILYTWFGMGVIQTKPAWWVLIGLASIAAVNMAQETKAWKRIEFGCAVGIFLFALYYSIHMNGKLHIYALFGCIMFIILLIHFLHEKTNLINRHGYDIIVAELFLLPELLLVLTADIRQLDGIMFVVLMLALVVIVICGWNLGLENGLGIFALESLFAAQFFLIRASEGGANTLFLIGISMIFWAFFGICHAKGKQIFCDTQKNLKKCIIFGIPFILSLFSLWMIQHNENYFYLERNSNFFDEQTANLLHGVLVDKESTVDSITIEWASDNIVTLTPDTIAGYQCEIQDSDAKITLQLKDGSTVENRQYFVKRKLAEKVEENGEETQN